MSVRVTRRSHAGWRGTVVDGDGRIGLGSGFVDLAERAKDTCPVSRALTGTEIVLEAVLADS